MLAWLKNSEKNIVSGTLAMFVGGWLMLFCQTCLASGESNDQSNISNVEMAQHCHSTDCDSNNTEDQSSLNDDHCLGACDCDEMPGTLTNVETVKHPDKFKSVSFYNHIFILSSVPEQEIVNTTYPISIFPERLRLLPLKHFTVLLI